MKNLHRLAIAICLNLLMSNLSGATLSDYLTSIIFRLHSKATSTMPTYFLSDHGGPRFEMVDSYEHYYTNLASTIYDTTINVFRVTLGKPCLEPPEPGNKTYYIKNVSNSMFLHVRENKTIDEVEDSDQATLFTKIDATPIGWSGSVFMSLMYETYYLSIKGNTPSLSTGHFTWCSSHGCCFPEQKEAHFQPSDELDSYKGWELE